VKFFIFLRSKDLLFRIIKLLLLLLFLFKKSNLNFKLKLIKDLFLLRIFKSFLKSETLIFEYESKLFVENFELLLLLKLVSV
jgi:hypothetical protein